LYSQLFHKIDEQDSGEITEYHVFSNIYTRSPTPIPRAPPEAPSPTIIVIMGTLDAPFQKYFLHCSPWPRSQLLVQDKHRSID
jgi:hypothetical protein